MEVEDIRAKIDETETSLDLLDDEIEETVNQLQALDLERAQASAALQKRQAKRKRLEKKLTQDNAEVEA